VQSAAEKIWKGSDGLLTAVETPQIAHARQLREMYNVLQNDVFDTDERIDVLMTIKNTIKVIHSLQLCRLLQPLASQLLDKSNKPMSSIVH